MSWTVVVDPEYAAWFLAERDRVRAAIVRAVALLAVEGPRLGRPLVDAIQGSDLDHLKELRVQVGGRPYRILFAFDPIRRAVLLLGGDKGSDDRWYVTHVPIAEARYARHLQRVAAEEKARAEAEAEARTKGKDEDATRARPKRRRKR